MITVVHYIRDNTFMKDLLLETLQTNQNCILPYVYTKYSGYMIDLVLRLGAWCLSDKIIIIQSFFSF